MSRLIPSLFGLSFIISMILIMLRFTGPDLRFCRVSGFSQFTRTVCFGVLEFHGDDILSAFRISTKQSQD